jgi:hypothetical protein
MACKSLPAITDSCDIVYTLPSQDADCFPVFLDLAEYQGFDYSMTWPGLYTCAFTSCSPLAIGTIVNPGDGISHAWYTCQAGPIAVPGWGWIYDTGQVCLTDHPTAGGIIVGACPVHPDSSAVLDTLLLINTGCAGIGGVEGDSPCKNATSPTTWGDVKGLFR